jgi:hypothetical protein
LGRHNKRLADATIVGQDFTMPAAELAADLTAILASCNERLFDLQKQATEVAFAEAAAAQAAWLKAVTAMAGLMPQASDRANTMQMIEIVNAWLQVVAQTQTALIGLIGHVAMAGGREATTAPLAHPPPVERRRLAVVIDFPDRRRAV